MDNSDEKKISGNDAAHTTIEIKIKTLLSHETPTLRVENCIRVSALKEQIAVVTGVVSDHQRLIYRGGFLNDDKLLSDYHVEDGDTLHMVKQENVSNPRETAPGSSSGHSQGNNSGAYENLSEQDAQDISTVPRIVSALIDHFGIESLQSENEEPFRMTRLGHIDMHSGFVPSVLNVDVTMRTGARTPSSQRQATPGNFNNFQASYQSHGDGMGVALFFPEDVNFQDVNTNSTAEDPVASENTAPQDTMPTVEDEGVFMSNLLRQIMPFISESSGTTPTIPPLEEMNAAEDRSNDGSAQQE